jgi:3-oxoacyl-[acyl-carrier protein] reductase
MSELNGRVALVTGAAQGIGKAIALKLAHSGADAILSDMNVEGAETAAHEIEAIGRKAIATKCNVADANDVAELVKRSQTAFPSIDILVNNAGVTRDNLLLRMEEKDWDMVLDVNLKGTYLVTRAVVPVMMKQRYGRIVNVASVVGLMGNAGQANYAASKGGVVAFTRSVAKEFASRNITCNAVAPGFIATAMTDKLNDKVKEEYLKAIPLHRFGSADDVASAVFFLVSDDSCYVTGQILSIDGGMAMR